MGRLVFTNGCFDLLHPGHIELLRFCREVAGPDGVVVVGLNSDASARRLKGEGRPVVNQIGRATSLRAVKYVDHVFIFDEPDPSRLIEQIRPDIVVKGWDYRDKPVIAGSAHVIISPKFGECSTSKTITKMMRYTDE